MQLPWLCIHSTLILSPWGFSQSSPCLGPAVDTRLLAVGVLWFCFVGSKPLSSSLVTDKEVDQITDLHVYLVIGLALSKVEAASSCRRAEQNSKRQIVKPEGTGLEL